MGPHFYMVNIHSISLFPLFLLTIRIGMSRAMGEEWDGGLRGKETEDFFLISLEKEITLVKSGKLP
jgi:hypothetical protein